MIVCELVVPEPTMAVTADPLGATSELQLEEAVQLPLRAVQVAGPLATGTSK